MAYVVSEMYITIAIIVFSILALAIKSYEGRNKWDYAIAVLLSVFWPATFVFYFYRLYITYRDQKHDN